MWKGTNEQTNERTYTTTKHITTLPLRSRVKINKWACSWRQFWTTDSKKKPKFVERKPLILRICGLQASSAVENKKPKNRSDQIMLVSTLEAKELLQTAAKKRDELGKTVLRRLSNVIDLVAAKGRYHRRCHKSFFTPVNVTKVVAFVTQIWGKDKNSFL